MKNESTPDTHHDMDEFHKQILRKTNQTQERHTSTQGSIYVKQAVGGR